MWLCCTSVPESQRMTSNRSQMNTLSTLNFDSSFALSPRNRFFVHSFRVLNPQSFASPECVKDSTDEIVCTEGGALCVWLNKKLPLYTDLWLVRHFTLYQLKLILVFIKPLLDQFKGKASCLEEFSHSSDSSVINKRQQRHRGMGLIKKKKEKKMTRVIFPWEGGLQDVCSCYLLLPIFFEHLIHTLNMKSQTSAICSHPFLYVHPSTFQPRTVFLFHACTSVRNHFPSHGTNIW